MATKQKALALDELTAPQSDSDNPAYRAYVDQKIRQGQADVKKGKTVTEEEVWKELGIEN